MKSEVIMKRDNFLHGIKFTQSQSTGFFNLTEFVENYNKYECEKKSVNAGIRYQPSLIYVITDGEFYISARR